MSSRRQFLRIAAAGALLPFVTHRAIAATPAGPFIPPLGPMRFTRSLRRELGGGAAMGAERGFTVRFRARADGFVIEGEQVGEAVVEAPPSLEAIAKLERERRETGLFPVTLDRAGLIVDYDEGAGSPQLDQAVEEALHRIAASRRGADDQAEMRTFVLGLQQAAASLLIAPPPDLFRPLSAPHSETREVALPDGSSGSVSVEFTAEADPASGLLRKAERVVLTRLAGSERRAVERWSLAAI